MHNRKIVGFSLSLVGVVIFGSLFSIGDQHRAECAEPRAVFVASQSLDDQITLRLILPYNAAHPGLAHYVEHLTVLSAHGGRLPDQSADANASTTPVSITYYLSGSRGELKRMLHTLSKVFEPIMVDPKMADSERDIILREHDLRILQDTVAQADEAMNAFLYEGNPQAISTIGTPDQIRGLTFEQAKAFHEDTHSANRAILLAIGAVSERELESALIESDFPALAKRDVLRPATFKLADPAQRLFTFADPGASPQMIWRKVVKLPRPVSYDLLYNLCDFLDDMLITALPGGLAKPLRYDKFIARRFDVSVYPLDEQHVELAFTAEPDQAISITAMHEAFEVTIREVLRGVPKNTFDRVQRRFLDATPSKDDRLGSENWVAYHALNRLSAIRLPPMEGQLRRLDHELKSTSIDKLAVALNGPGRVAIAFIGEEDAK